DGANLEALTLLDHHGVALVAQRLGGEDEADREHELFGGIPEGGSVLADARHRNTGVVLAVMAPDDARDLVDAVPKSLRGDADEAVAAGRLEGRGVIAKPKDGTVEWTLHLHPTDLSGHVVHRRTRPRLELARVASSTRLTARVVPIFDVAPYLS